MCCWENSCEFTWDVVLMGLASACSIVAVWFGIKGFTQGKSCCDGWGSMSAHVLSNLEIFTGLLFLLIPPFSALCTWVTVQSFFHTGRFRIAQLECLTTSAGLRCLQLSSHGLFFLSLFISQLLLCWLLGSSVLALLCSNKLLSSPAQVLVLGMSRAPSNAIQELFQQSEVPFLTLSLRDALNGLNLNTYCAQSAHSDQYLYDLWLGSLLLTLSQSLMAVALRGEKQRVSVHELHEDDLGLGGEVQGLLKNAPVVSGIASLVGGPVAGTLAGAAVEAYDRRS